MELFAAAGLINGVVAISFGLLVAFKNLRERANQIFFLMTVSLAIWSLGYWRWLSIIDNYDLAFFWVRILSLGSLFIPVLFLHWVTILVGEDKGLNKLITGIGYFVATGISLLINSSLFITGLEMRSFFPFWPDSGIAYDIYFSFIYIGFVVYALYLLIRSFSLSHDKNKRGQILFIIWGAILGFGGGLTNFPLWWGIPILPYGNFLVAAFPFLLGYSVLHYRLFNAKAIAAEILVFFTVIILFVQVILSKTFTEFILRSIFAIVVSILGILVIRNVYKEIEQRERIEKLAEELQGANKRQENLLHFINHEVKGYLTADAGAFAGILEGDYGEISPQMKEMVENALKHDRMGVDMVVEMLTSSNIKSGKIQFASETFDLKPELLKLIDQVKGEAAARNLMLETKVDDGDSYMVSGDREKIVQHVLKNLIMNAILYTPKGGIITSLSKYQGKIIFSVKDSGVGITAEDMENLFSEGGKGKDSIKVNAHSTGYGLFISKQIVDAHQGRIWAQSKGPGQGSTFFVEFPAK